MHGQSSEAKYGSSDRIWWQLDMHAIKATRYRVCRNPLAGKRDPVSGAAIRERVAFESKRYREGTTGQRFPVTGATGTGIPGTA